MCNRAQQVPDILGLPDLPVPPSQRLGPRQSQEVVVHRNGYQPDRSKGILDYEVPFRQFREEQGVKDKSFAQAVAFASNAIEAMDDRENLRAMVEARGFRLL
jgi:hypothetical protein